MEHSFAKYEKTDFKVRRSPQWRGVREEFIKQNPFCAVCGGNTELEVHHKQPFWIFPERELDPNNLITLCERPNRNCHLLYGHLLKWRAYNPSVQEDAERMREKIRNRDNIIDKSV